MLTLNKSWEAFFQALMIQSYIDSVHNGKDLQR
ncbi:hypothetical protein OsccyDRAFT_3345 [Leptolyngbyaceae cyanobacterium JSC-12]|nr:hypothetical protein OsccyDRAFT_3345 [Leptolyngbyaceae cyanobacterium JSC-12]